MTITILVACVIAIPVAMQVRHVMLAEATWPGSVGSSIYRQGSSYSDRIAAIAHRDALGWHIHIDIERTGETVYFDIELRDRKGQPVTVVAPQVTIMHPLREALDLPPLAAESVAPGRYRTTVRLPRSGKWRLRFETRTNAGDLFRREFDVRVPAG